MAPEAIQQSEVVSILGRVSLFQGIGDNLDALAELAKMLERKRFTPGSTVIRESEVSGGYFILVQGQVSIFKKTADGENYKVAILKHDTVPGFGEGGLIEHEPRSATIVCDTDCECLYLNQDSFDLFSSQHPDWALPIHKKIASQLLKRLRHLNDDLLLLHKALMNEIRG